MDDNRNTVLGALLVVAVLLLLGWLVWKMNG
jgi:hypothetical protein